MRWPHCVSLQLENLMKLEHLSAPQLVRCDQYWHEASCTVSAARGGGCVYGQDFYVRWSRWRPAGLHTGENLLLFQTPPLQVSLLHERHSCFRPKQNEFSRSCTQLQSMTTQGQGKASIENVTQKVALISPSSARRLMSVSLTKDSDIKNTETDVGQSAAASRSPSSSTALLEACFLHGNVSYAFQSHWET